MGDYWFGSGSSKPKEIAKETPKVEIPKNEKKKYIDKELDYMSKVEQVKILEELGIVDIPKTEKERIKLILEKQ